MIFFTFISFVCKCLSNMCIYRTSKFNSQLGRKLVWASISVKNTLQLGFIENLMYCGSLVLVLSSIFQLCMNNSVCLHYAFFLHWNLLLKKLVLILKFFLKCFSYQDNFWCNNFFYTVIICFIKHQF